LAEKLSRFIATGKPVLITDGLADQLTGKVPLDARNVQILHVAGNPKSLQSLSEDELNKLRAPLLRSVSTTFRGPGETGLYLFRDGSWVVENFNDTDAHYELDGKSLTVPARGWVKNWKRERGPLAASFSGLRPGHAAPVSDEGHSKGLAGCRIGR
jgi:hypothetical protein